MTACNTTHAGYGRHGWRNWARSQINDSLAVGSRTCNALRRTLADQQTVAWATHVLLSRRCITNWLQEMMNMNNLDEICVKILTYGCLIALGALDDMLLPFIGNVNHSLADTARHHRHAALHGLLIRWWQFIRSNRRDCSLR